ncbi:MAG: N-6 DNA methylase [Bacteroidetes bacterium]|uniref:DNA methyltransferase n=1 Tax=Phnomibacter sp. TaxID=2836217 RepID=UPI002FDE7023|nr:N-6 DNA methylase [Bacteroidota bacterium]
MNLSLNEIKTRATAFAKDWEQTEGREEADAKEFLIDFLNIFGISRKRVATFEHRVKKLSEADGYIDLLWKGRLLVEMKSKGKDLSKAYTQAKEYCHGLKEHELPELIMVSDFYHVKVYDADGQETAFTLPQLLQYITVFYPLAGIQKRTFADQDPVNIKAAELMGQLHDELKAIGYEGHPLELYLVRLLFLLFADDTSIFERGIFQEYIDRKTNEDGSDLAMHLHALFGVLNTPPDKRLKTLDEQLMQFPYVNGKLFEENLPVAAFSSSMRRLLLQCCTLDWGKISPAIFGSLFQSVMDPTERRNLGAHYTSEKNILKVIQPLFLDELKAEHGNIRHDKNKLKKLHQRISQLRFLDPACGCGNFLIIAYRELRLLEMDIVKDLLQGQIVTDIGSYFLLDVDQFYGIEYEEFPAQIAQVAMWLMDHQMNLQASQTFGEYYVRLPLRKSATIVHGNALRIDWQSIIKTMPWDAEGARFDYIMGNPPFYGYAWQNDEQKNDMAMLFGSVKGSGVLDYVSGWYFKGAQYLKAYNHAQKIKVGFVSTNSITQGEQVGLLWKLLVEEYGVKIHFAHRTFKWNNDARGNAAVHVVIIGFSNYDKTQKQLFSYENISGEPDVVNAKNINPYLVEAKDVFIEKRKNPLCNVPAMTKGSSPTDGGNLLLSEVEKNELISNYPKALKFVRNYIGSEEYINSLKRYCLWLEDINPNELKEVPPILERLKKVKDFRNVSTKAATVKWAKFPSVFIENRQPKSNYLLIPRVSSENREYIPIGYLDAENIASDSAITLPNSSLFHFGVLTSSMHMAWVKQVCGRLKSDYRYSNTIVYNNFPWPLSPTDKQKQAVEAAAQQVLDARAQFPDASLADLYDPNTMPPVLVKAHQALDKAVDLCYRPQPFTSETKRIEYLFELYDQYTAGLFAGEGKKKGKKKA